MGRCSSEAEQRFRKPQAKGSTPFTGSTFYALSGNGLYLMPPGHLSRSNYYRHAHYHHSRPRYRPSRPTHRHSRVSGNPDGTAV